MVRISSIRWTNAPYNASRDLLPTPISAFIDSAVPHIWLPDEACKAFEGAFNLTYNETDKTYWVDDKLHDELTKSNPEVTFKLDNPQPDPAVVRLTMPYASFDLQYPAFGNMRYFPLAKAANETQYTLGRTFLQEAYVTVDYERGNFSVSQARFEGGLEKKIVTIHSTDKHPSNRKVIGGVLGGASALVVLIIAVLLFVWWRRKRHQSAGAKGYSISSPSTNTDGTSDTYVSGQQAAYVREIDTNSLVGPYRELHDVGKVELLDEKMPSGSGNAIPEISMVQAMPVELRTRHSSMDTVSPQSWYNRDSHIASIVESPVREPEAAHLQSGMTSRATSKAFEDIYVSYDRVALDLEKPLPPTPGLKRPTRS